MRLLFIYVCTFQYLKFLFLTWCESYKSYMYVCVKVKGKEMGDCHWPLTIDSVGCADADQLERQLFTVSVDREIVLPGFVEWVVGDRCCTTRHRCGPATFFCCFRQGLSVVEDQWLRWIIPFLPMKKQVIGSGTSGARPVWGIRRRRRTRRRTRRWPEPPRIGVKV